VIWKSLNLTAAIGQDRPAACRTAIRLAAVRDYNIAMNKRLTFGICIIILGAGVFVRAGASRSMHWTKIPSVTVVSAAGDSRIEAVREAIAFRNRTFADMGTPFRLGEPNFVTGTIPDGDIQSLGNQVLHNTLRPTTPEAWNECQEIC
jgi:hypothetical protein